MLELIQLDNQHRFPHPNHALHDPNGLLAFGGDLSVERLICAYRNGIFPWFNEGEPILWWSPNPRGIMELDEFHISRSFARFLRKHNFTVTLNHAFASVIDACANMVRKPAYYNETAEYSDDRQTAIEHNASATWITTQMTQAYLALHQAGYAHSIEVWQHKQLVGGLYGVSFGAVFCGESMFHHVSNASKLAYYYLVMHMRNKQMDFIDCQLQNPYLQSMGCKEIPRQQFLHKLHSARDKVMADDLWVAQRLSETK